MIVRIRTRERVVRLEINQPFNHHQLYSQVSSEYGSDCHLSFDPQGQQIIQRDQNSHPDDWQNGRMIFLHAHSREPPKQQGEDMEEARNQINSDCPESIANTHLDAFLSSADGKIKRERDPYLCSHSAKGMCSHCQPLEPWDPGYLKENGIKYLSWHSWLTKQGRPKSLEQPTWEIKPGCSGHAPPPAAMCSACQPSSIALKAPVYRQVDHVEFCDQRMVDEWLQVWRGSGKQQIALLIGNYEAYPTLPLGIKASVKSTWMPQQKGFPTGFQADLEDDAGCEAARLMAAKLGMEVVGMIYTDLHYSAEGRLQHRKDCSVSSRECMFMAQEQERHPFIYNANVFGSRFVSVRVGGDKDGNVALSAWQLSVQGQCLINEGCITATTDDTLMAVNTSTPTKYIPELFYNVKGRGQLRADPTFPVEYLLVSLTHGFPVREDAVKRPFLRFDPVPNPPAYLNPLPTNAEGLRTLLSNFSLVVALYLDGFPETDRLIECLNVGDFEAMIPPLRAYISDRTAINLDNEDDGADQENIAKTGSHWTCKHCTFINEDAQADSCALCALPK